MILRHVEAVTVDERGLDQRPHLFSESKCDKLPLHHPQEPQVRMVLARKGPRNSRRYIVASKLDLLPLTRDNHVASKGTYLWLGWGGCPNISSGFGNLDFTIIPSLGLDKVPLGKPQSSFS